ncbi:MAG: 50S ribosomal protein L21 [Gammaproteobacteria bacterium]|nr:MAG: 50S ribosomal protein L21 [Gammaproteobacteria bacterium]
MYAVIKTGGKQYRVSPGQRLKIEKLEQEVDSVVQFDEVLLTSDGDKLEIGTPFLKGISVSAKLLQQGRGKKIEIIKFKRRKHHRKQMGHRQSFSEVEITAIGGIKTTTKTTTAKTTTPKKTVDKTTKEKTATKIKATTKVTPKKVVKKKTVTLKKTDTTTKKPKE